MKKIRILGTRPFKHPFPLFSWLIRLIEWSRQSHVVVHDVQENKISHARFNNVIWQDYDEFMKDNIITEAHEFEIEYEQWVALRAFISFTKGKQSGYFVTLAGLIIPVLLRTISKDKILIDGWPYKGQSCSWYTYESMTYIGGPIAEVFKDQKVKPHSLTTGDILLSAKKFVDLNKN